VRRRITALLVAVMTLALTVLGIPLARSIAEGERQQLYVSRLADAARFASLAQQVETDVDLAVLRLELVRYEEVYGVPAAVLDREGVPLAASRTPLVLGDGGAAAVAVALTGRRADGPQPAPPLAARPLVVVEPVVVGGDVTSVVVTMSPTEALRERVLVAWVLLGAGMVAALLLCWALAVGLAGWVLRPVHALDEATQAVGTGRLTARVPQTIGPPELRRLGGAFNAMAESVEALLAQQRTFVADASHQLRNPLSALLLRLDSVALAEPDLDVRLEPVRAEGRRLTEVLDELLQLARTEHATTVAVPVPLGPLVRDRDEAWQVVARRKGVLLDVHVHGDPVALAEATALSGAVDALLDNAIKFSPTAVPSPCTRNGPVRAWRATAW
jgi:signal transduction histidine kinase